MSLVKKGKIDVTKILKEHLFQGQKGKYLDVAFFENEGEKNKYGDDGFIVQEVGKEARQQGVKGPIIGNWRYFEANDKKPVKKADAAPAPKADSEDDDVPF